MKNQTWTLKSVKEYFKNSPQGKIVNPRLASHVSEAEEAIMWMDYNLYDIELLLEEHSLDLRKLDRDTLMKDCTSYVDGDVNNQVDATFEYYSKKTIQKFLDTLDIAVFKNSYRGFSMNIAKAERSHQSNEDKCCSLLVVEWNANSAASDLSELYYILAHALGKDEDDDD